MSEPCKKCSARVYLGIGHTCPDTACYYHVPVTPASPSRARPSQPPVPQAFFDEFGKGADDRVWDYGYACAQAALQGAITAAPESRAGDCVTIPAHGIETMLSAATLLELSTNPIDRAEGAALRRLTTKATP